MSLTTGKRIKRSHWTELPMPTEVIARVNQLGKADGMTSSLVFYDRHGREIGEHDVTMPIDEDDVETPGVMGAAPTGSPSSGFQ